MGSAATLHLHRQLSRTRGVTGRQEPDMGIERAMKGDGQSLHPESLFLRVQDSYFLTMNIENPLKNISAPDPSPVASDSSYPWNWASRLQLFEGQCGPQKTGLWQPPGTSPLAGYLPGDRHSLQGDTAKMNPNLVPIDTRSQSAVGSWGPGGLCFHPGATRN